MGPTFNSPAWAFFFLKLNNFFLSLEVTQSPTKFKAIIDSLYVFFSSFIYAHRKNKRSSLPNKFQPI